MWLQKLLNEGINQFREECVPGKEYKMVALHKGSTQTLDAHHCRSRRTAHSTSEELHAPGAKEP